MPITLDDILEAINTEASVSLSIDAYFSDTDKMPVRLQIVNDPEHFVDVDFLRARLVDETPNGSHPSWALVIDGEVLPSTYDQAGLFS